MVYSAWVAPEMQKATDSFDASADVCSWGLLLWSLLTRTVTDDHLRLRRPPWRGASSWGSRGRWGGDQPNPVGRGRAREVALHDHPRGPLRADRAKHQRQGRATLHAGRTPPPRADGRIWPTCRRAYPVREGRPDRGAGGEGALASPEPGPEVADLLAALADLYGAGAEHSQAQEAAEEALAIDQRALPPYHPSFATSLNNLVLLYRAKGEYDRALSLHEEALAIRRRALPPDHPDIAASLNNLESLYRDKGEYDRAVALHAEALTIMRRALPPDHPNIAVFLNKPGYPVQGQGGVRPCPPAAGGGVGHLAEGSAPRTPRPHEGLQGAGFSHLLRLGWRPKGSDSAKSRHADRRP